MKCRIQQLLLSGLACAYCAGNAFGQQIPPSPGEVDPTPETPMMCIDLVIPPFGVTIPNTHPNEGCETWAGVVPLNPPTVDLTPIGYSATWFNASNTWQKDRRPAAVIQLANSTFAVNPRAVVDWWWKPITFSETEVEPDVPVDAHGPNPDVDHWPPLDPNSGSNGIPDQFDTLMWTIKHHMSAGFRRVILHLPAGVTFGKIKERIPGGSSSDYLNWVVEAHSQSMNQFRALPLWKQYYFVGLQANGGQADPTGLNPNLMTAWKAFVSQYCSSNPAYDPSNPDKLSIEIYMGDELNDGQCGLATGATVNSTLEKHTWVDDVSYDGNVALRHITNSALWSEPYPGRLAPVIFDPRVASHMQRLWYEIAPWYLAGARTIWFDSGGVNDPAHGSVPSDGRLYGTLELSQNPSIRALGIRFGGEAVPVGFPSGDVPNDCAVQKMRWFCNDVVAFKPQTRIFKDAFTWSKQTEVHIFGTGEDCLSWDEWAEARRRNFVVGIYNGLNKPTQLERAKRWYSMGNIEVADFNGDGIVDANDATAFTDALASSLANPGLLPVVFATGDIDQNGVIDQSDATLFFQYYYSHGNQGYPTFLYYGLADGL